MKLQAKTGCYLTESAEVPIEERHFHPVVVLAKPSDAAKWREVTEGEKEQIIQNATVLGVDKLDAAYLTQVDALIEAIPTVINGKSLTASEALEHKNWYPRWGETGAEMGKQVSVGFRLRHQAEGEEEDTLYEVIQAHTLQAEWVPGVGTESLYKVVQEEHAGTPEDPIPWQKNMALELDKYYTEEGVLYHCIRSSEGMGLDFNLVDLISGGYVEAVVNEE